MFIGFWIGFDTALQQRCLWEEPWRAGLGVLGEQERERMEGADCWKINLILVLKLNKLGNKGRLFSFSTLAEF
jgi:hypothetical protein